MKIVYIAGPLTTGWDGKDNSVLRKNIERAEAYQVALANEAIGTFCPHAHTSMHNEKGSTAPESYYYELDCETYTLQLCWRDSAKEGTGNRWFPDTTQR